MSTTQATAAHGHDDHADAHGPPDHHPHVLPLSTYFGVFGTLVVLTGITVGVSYIDLGAANLFIALAVATVKAMCVALIFMHLLFDKKFNAIVFSSSLLFLAIFIGFTMSDTSYRGLDGRSAADGPADIKDPFAKTRSQAALEKMYAKPSDKKEDIQSEAVGPKTDIGLHDATPQPMVGTAMIVDVPPAAEMPGATPPRVEKEE